MHPAEGNARFTQGTYAVVEGDTARISVARGDGDRGAVSVKWELLAGATDSDDLSMASGVLSWADGDDQSQEIVIPINANDGDEHQESFFVRLYDPRGSLALAAPNIAVISIAASQLTADAGVDTAMPTDTLVRLTGVGSSPHTDELSYQWQQTSGATVTLQQADSASAQFTAPNTAATLVFELTATDGTGANSSDTVSVSVQAPVPRRGGGGAPGYLLLLTLALYLTRRRANGKRTRYASTEQER